MTDRWTVSASLTRSLRNNLEDLDAASQGVACRRQERKCSVRTIPASRNCDGFLVDMARSSDLLIVEAYTSPWTVRLGSLFLVVATFIVAAALPAAAQDFSRIRFNVGGGVGYPQGNLSTFVNSSGNFVAGGGYNFAKYFGVSAEYFWEDMPINDRVLQQLNTTTETVRAQQYALTVNPIVEVPLVRKFGTYVIGGVGWYHRSGQTSVPGVGVICDPYWSWWYGCTITSTDIVTKSRSSNAFGKNIGVGVTYRLGETHLKIYAEVRYHEASYNNVPTKLVPITFGVRW